MKKSMSKAKALLSILLVLAMIVPAALPSYAATRVNGNSKAAVEDLKTETNEAEEASEQSSQEALEDDSAQTNNDKDAASKSDETSQSKAADTADAATDAKVATDADVAEKNTEEGEELQSLDDLFMDFSGTGESISEADRLGFTYRNGSTDPNCDPKDVYFDKKIMITEVNSPVADPYTSSFGIDSDQDFSFIVSPYPGYELPDNYIKSIIYDKYSSESVHTEKKLSFSSYYAVDIENSYYKNKGYRTGSKLVTLPAAVLKSIESNVFTADNGEKYGKNIVLELGQASPATYRGITVTAEAEDGIKLKSYSSSLLYTKVDDTLSVPLSKLISNMEDVNPAELSVKVTVYDSSNNILNSFTQAAGKSVVWNKYLEEGWCGIDLSYYTLNIYGDFENLYADNCSVVIDLTGRSSSTYYPIESSMDTKLVSACKVLRTVNQDGSFRYTLKESDKKAIKGEDLYLAFYTTKKRVIEPECRIGNKTVELIPVTDYDDISGSSGKYIDLYKIEAEDIADKVTLYAKTKEYVKLEHEKNNYAAFTEDGSEITNLDGAALGASNEDLGFFIIPADGYVVDNVTYSTENSPISKSRPASPNLMSIPASDVNSTVYISSIPEYTSVRGEEVTINTQNSTSLYTASAISLNINDDIVTTPFSTVTTSLSATGHIGEPFYFQIQGSNTTDLNTVVDSLLYEMDGEVGTLTPIAVTPAVTGEGGIKQESVYWYVIPEVTGNVIIAPSARSGDEIVTLKSPENENIYFYIDGKLLKDGESVEVVKGTKVNIEVAAIGSKDTSTVKLSDFGYVANGKTYYYNSGMSDPSYSDFKNGSWEFPANYDTTFFAWTNEYVNSDNFVTVFDGPDIKAGTEGLDEKGIAAVSTTDENGNALDLSVVNKKELATMVSAQSALLSVSSMGDTDAQSETHNQSFDLSDTKIYPYMSPDKDHLGSPIDGDLTIEIEKESDGKYAGSYLNSYVYGIKPGKASAVAKLTVKGKTTNPNSYGEMTDSTYNRLIYTADSDETKTNGRLAIEVVDHYNSIGIYSDTDNIYASEGTIEAYNVARLWVSAHDNITNTTKVLDAFSDPSINYVDWTFKPDTRYNNNPSHVFCSAKGEDLTEGKGNFYLIAPYEIYEARSGSDEGSNKYVYIKGSDTEEVIVNASYIS
ncbi:MAG: hypothetical protein K5931_11320 [Lachnospiraceae bacterium]|nr:hypothetical protein [Lachnospiraceae bacterium]